MSTHYLFDNAVMDRCAKLATGHEVESELEFADRLLLLATIPAVPTPDGAELDSFMDRVRVWQRAEVSS